MIVPVKIKYENRNYRIRKFRWDAAKLFTKAGHEVAISNSRGPESLKSFVSSVGPNIKANTVEDAIKLVR